MSETEHLKGKLIPIFSNTSIPFTQQRKEIESANGIIFGGFDYDEYDEWINPRTGFISLGGTIYKIEQTVLDPYEDINTLTENEDGSFSFECRFYNGGGCLDELLTKSLNQLKDGEK